MRITLIIISLLSVCTVSGQTGYGDRVNGYPNWQERAILVLTNACRMAPVQYRDAYVGAAYSILLPANYKAVPPLYWNLQLATAARFHCVQMADTCGMTHNSCNGDAFSTRLQSFYKNKSATIGEDIATGYADPFSTMQQWLLDKDSTGKVAADLSFCPPTTTMRCDGHRWNIMYKAYREIGTGYAYGAKPFRYFWDQDFGGGKPEFDNPIVSGVHLFPETGKTTFMANYFDSVGKPSEASLYVDNQKTAMTLAMGADSAGTYTVVLTKGSSCRYYYFSFKDSKGNVWRYPETGYLVTSGEGTCTKDFIPPESLSVNEQTTKDAGKTDGIKTRVAGSMLFLYVNSSHDSPVASSLFDLQGRVVVACVWQKEPTLSVRLPRPLAKGVYCILHLLASGRQVLQRLTSLQ